MKTDDFAVHHAIALQSVGGTADHLRSLTPDYFDAWVATAQPGARVIYGMGIDAHSASGRDVPRRLMRLYEAGLVILHQKRSRIDGQYPIDFIAVRRAKPVPKGFPVLPREPYSGAGRTTNVAGK